MWYGIACGISLITTGLILAPFAYRNEYLSLPDYFAPRYNSWAMQLICIVTNLMSGIAVFAGQLLAGKTIFYVAESTALRALS